MIDRRAFIGGFGAMVVWPLAARAQTARTPLIGYIGLSSADGDKRFLEALRQGLREAGLIDGQNIRIESRHAGGDATQANAIIAELTGLKADILIVPGPAAAYAARRVSRLPIIALQLPPGQSNPELYESLARPGWNLTGFSSMGEGLSAKRIELLKELLPNLKVIGILHNGTDPNFRDWGAATEADARALGLAVSRQPMMSNAPAELAKHFAALKADGATALIVIRDFATTALKDEIARAAEGAGIAVASEHRDYAEAGALLSYGPDVFELFRRAGGYIDKILKGEKPGELPIQLPTKFELVVNGRTAKALGITIPPSILIRADEVLE
jgi:putative tryptophan/tyrosine transport system substrate-binding protein